MYYDGGLDEIPLKFNAKVVSNWIVIIVSMSENKLNFIADLRYRWYTQKYFIPSLEIVLLC